MDTSTQSYYKEHWLIAYDISSSSNRSKLHRRLKKLAIGSQKSYFEILANEEEMIEIAELASSLIEPESDKLLIACTTKTLSAYRYGGHKPLTQKGLLIIS